MKWSIYYPSNDTDTPHNVDMYKTHIVVSAVNTKQENNQFVSFIRKCNDNHNDDGTDIPFISHLKGDEDATTIAIVRVRRHHMCRQRFFINLCSKTLVVVSSFVNS